MAHGDEDDVGLHALLRLGGVDRRRPALAHGADHLGLHHEGAAVAGLVRLDGDGRHERHHLHTFADGALHLAGKGGHVLKPASIDDADLLGTGAHARAGAVHGDVAAADDRHLLAGEVGNLAVADAAQKVDCRAHAHGVGSFQAQFLADVRSDGDIDGVVGGRDGAHLFAAYVGLIAHFDVGKAADGTHVLVETGAGEAVGRDAVAHHAACLLLLFKNGDVVSHEGQKVGAGEARGAGADDGYLATGVNAGGGHGDLVGRELVDGELLDAADVDGGVDERAAAPRLAGVLAHQRAGGGEGVVLADVRDGAGIVALRGERDVARHVDVRGAHRLARHGLAHGVAAVALLDMAGVLVGEVVHAGEHLAGRLVADGAVRCVTDDFGQGPCVGERLRVCLAVGDFAEHAGKLGQAVAARHALAACLRRAHLGERHLEGHGAHACRRCGEAARELVHHCGVLGVRRSLGYH